MATATKTKLTLGVVTEQAGYTGWVSTSDRDVANWFGHEPRDQQTVFKRGDSVLVVDLETQWTMHEVGVVKAPWACNILSGSNEVTSAALYECAGYDPQLVAVGHNLAGITMLMAQS